FRHFEPPDRKSEQSGYLGSTLTGDDGVTASLEKGDMLFIPRGSVFDWKSLVDVTKLFGSQC
ncbi:MAG: hypothetical protein ABI790_08160, partial [Betaproteobacteria bacterium]